MSDTLRALWHASQALHERFAIFPPYTDAISRKLVEECYELTTEAALWQNHPSVDVESVAREAADVLVCALGVLMSVGGTYADLEAAIERVTAKNNAKTTATHEVDGRGMIVKKGVLK